MEVYESVNESSYMCKVGQDNIISYICVQNMAG